MAAPILDLRLIVNRVASQEDDTVYYTAVADAPTERFGVPMGSFRFAKLEGSEGQWGPQYPRSSLILSRRQSDWYLHEQTDGDDEANIGEQLFRLLFPRGSEMLHLLHRSCDRVGQDAVLRVRLELDQQLANLPWELLRCPDDDLAAALAINSTKLAVVRYFGSVAPTRFAAVGQKRRTILLIESCPFSYGTPAAALSIHSEAELVRQRELQGHTCVSVSGPGTRRRIVQMVEEMTRAGEQIVGVHFVGHGEVDESGGYLVGEGDDGHPERIYARSLERALKPAQNIEWVLLNACYTGTTPQRGALAGVATALCVMGRIPIVLAHSGPVESRQAELFGRLFYAECVERERPVEDALWHVTQLLDRRSYLVVLQRSVEGQIREPQRRQAARPETASSVTAMPSAQAAVSAARPVGSFVEIAHGTLVRGYTQAQIALIVERARRLSAALDVESLRRELEKEAHERLPMEPFAISSTPVTCEQFQRFVQDTGYATDAERAGASATWRTAVCDTGGPDHPVVNVSFRDAEAYCAWAEARLPTPDEWVRAYRGDEGRIYPWGDEFSVERCNTAESCSGYATTPVRMHASGRSEFGCYDLVGNVEEWLFALTSDTAREMRGGSWQITCQIYGLPSLKRAAPPDRWFRDTGFRCARDL